jgi:hypothetical protein
VETIYMPYEVPFGLRVAATWRALVEHLNAVTALHTANRSPENHHPQPCQSSGEKEEK